MFRLGMFTGDIYESDVDVNTIHECCIMVNDDKRNDRNFLDNLRETNRFYCKRCMIYDYYHYKRCSDEKYKEMLMEKFVFDRDTKQEKLHLATVYGKMGNK